MAQSESTTAPTPLPYYEIPEAPATYTAGTVAARVVDGLGFRYYWATEGLREEDLSYKPSESSRTSGETIDHIYGLSLTIINAARKIPNESSADRPVLNFEEKRKRTLENIKNASEILKNVKDEEMESLNAVFKRGDSSSSYPFWNMLNGPIADAIWHTGQIVAFRRASGNPIHSKVSFFSGKLRE